MKRHIIMLGFSGLTAVACKPAKVHDTGQQNTSSTTPGALSIWPNGIDFGTVDLDDQTSELVSLTNEGEGNLEIYDVSFDDDNQRAHWSVEGETTSIIEPADSIEFAVVLHPQDTSDPSVRLIILSDDPTETNASIALTATVQGQPDIRVDPDNGIDMGTVAVGETSTQSVMIANDGTDDLLIESVTFSEASKTLSLEIDATGTSIPANSESGRVQLRFSPTQASSTTDSLVIVCNDPNQSTVELTVVGLGTK